MGFVAGGLEDASRPPRTSRGSAVAGCVGKVEKDRRDSSRGAPSAVVVAPALLASALSRRLCAGEDPRGVPPPA